MVGELDRAYGRIKHYALNATLAEKREHKIRNIFQKYVPQELIDRFFQNPEEMLVGDNRDLAILFSDIRGFTTISEGMRPDDLVNSLNRYFSTQVDIIMGHGGVIDKYIGDAIMAFFGAPIAHPDDRYQAVLAGIEMSQALETFNADQRAAGKPEFQIGVGIGCGEVTVGNIGTDRKMDYTVIGDVVNLASRLEGLTKMYKQQLLITGPLYQAVKEKIPVRAIDRVAVKGKTKGVSIFTAATNLTEDEAEAWKLHNTAMKYYYTRQFDHAAKALRGVLGLIPDDHVARLFLTRIEELKKHPPDESWKGIQVMETK
jgi:class 3 adenylate cyclase